MNRAPITWKHRGISLLFLCCICVIFKRVQHYKHCLNLQNLLWILLEVLKFFKYFRLNIWEICVKWCAIHLEYSHFMEWCRYKKKTSFICSTRAPVQTQTSKIATMYKNVTTVLYLFFVLGAFLMEWRPLTLRGNMISYVVYITNRRCIWKICLLSQHEMQKSEAIVCHRSSFEIPARKSFFIVKHRP